MKSCGRPYDRSAIHYTHYVRTVDTTFNGKYGIIMPSEILSVRFEMRSSPEWLARLDDWRRKQREIPSRAEAIRMLVENALKES